MPKQDSTCIDRHTGMRQLTQREVGEVFAYLDRLKDETSSFILLQADERYYRENYFWYNVITTSSPPALIQRELYHDA